MIFYTYKNFFVTFWYMLHTPGATYEHFCFGLPQKNPVFWRFCPKIFSLRNYPRLYIAHYGARNLMKIFWGALLCHKCILKQYGSLCDTVRYQTSLEKWFRWKFFARLNVEAQKNQVFAFTVFRCYFRGLKCCEMTF